MYAALTGWSVGWSADWSSARRPSRERGGERVLFTLAQGGVDALALEDLFEGLGGLLDRVLGEEGLDVGDVGRDG